MSSPTKTYPIARLSPESSPGQTRGESAKLSRCQTRDEFVARRVIMIRLIAETVWRRAGRFSSGMCHFPLMWISYEHTKKKKDESQIQSFWSYYGGLAQGRILRFFTNAHIKIIHPNKYQFMAHHQNGTFFSGNVWREAKEELQPADSETSWGVLVARADGRSRVQTRWLRFTVELHQSWSSSRLFLWVTRRQKCP